MRFTADFSRMRDAILLAILALLPWQTRFIKEPGLLAGISWEQGTISLYAMELLILAALVCHVLAIKPQTPNPKPQPPVFLRLWAILLLYSLLSLAWAEDAYATLFTWFHLFEGFALAYLILISKVSLKAMLAAFVVGCVPAAMLGLWEFFRQTSFASSWLGVSSHPIYERGVAVIETSFGRFARSYGPLPHPNIFGGYMAAALLSVVALLGGGLGRRARAATLVVSVLLIAGLFVSFSRSAWIAYALVMFPLAIFGLSSWSSDSAARLKKSIGIQLLAVAILLVMLWPMVVSRVGIQGRLERRSVDDRATSLSAAIFLFTERYAFGVGLGNMVPAAYDLLPSTRGFTYQPSHFVPALVASELGFFGVMMFLGAALFWAWGAVSRQPSAVSGRPLAQIMRWSPALLLVIGLFDHYLFTLFPGAILSGVLFGFSMKSAESEAS